MSVPLPTYARARRWSETLIETGTHDGHGVMAALLAGFKHVHTVELDPELMKRARSEVGGQWGAVQYYCGDSSELLGKILGEFAVTPVAVLLDAHPMNGGEEVGPLRKELEALKRAPRHDHLIMVDDFDLVGHEIAGITQHEVRTLLYAINHGYNFVVLDGHTRSQALLMAIPPGYPS